MKLFLASGGIPNRTLEKAFVHLIDKDLTDTTIAYIPTAANVEKGHKDWMINDMKRLIDLNFKMVEVIDISAIPQNQWEARLEQIDVLHFGGGNDFYLMKCIEESGLAAKLPQWLETKIWLGSSAGSTVTGSLIDVPLQPLYDLEPEYGITKGLGLVDFLVAPHYAEEYTPKLTSEAIQKCSTELQMQIYAIDDTSAVVVNGKEIKVVSEGTWKKFDPINI